MSFTDEEVAYIRSQRLARVATAAADGQPDVVPVGYEFDGTHFYIGGMDPANTRRARNIKAAARLPPAEPPPTKTSSGARSSSSRR